MGHSRGAWSLQATWQMKEQTGDAWRTHQYRDEQRTEQILHRMKPLKRLPSQAYPWRLRPTIREVQWEQSVGLENVLMLSW